MRILCLTPWLPSRPGAQSGNFILDSLQSLHALGHELETMVCQPWRPGWGGLLDPDWGQPRLRIDLHDKSLGIHALRYPSIPRNHCRPLSVWMFRRRVLPQLLGRLRAFKPDVVLVHTEQMGIVATEACCDTRIPVVTVIHGVNTSARLNTARERARIAAVLRASARVVLVGEPLLEYVRALAADTGNTRIVHNGVRLPRAGQLPRGNTSFRPLRLVSVSNLVEGKGVELNLQALAQAQREGLRDWTYTVVGGGELARQLQAQAQQLGIAANVRFTGPVDHAEVYAILGQSDVFLLPSWREAFGVAWLEAMACGLLTVAVAGQGPSAFIRHDETGLLVPPRDVAGIVACLHRITQEPENMRKLALQGTQLVTREFSWEQHAEKLAAVCREAIEDFQ